ncbi:MAG: phytanoyl-CoA dioxygenase family protein, partial [Ilumatobacteraceae bacterium]
MTATMLSDDQIRSFDRDGFVVLPGFASQAACDALRERAVQLVDTFEPTERRTVFTTNEQTRSSNEEFLSSGPKIWCFFEEAAFGDDGEMQRAKALSVNKIGHAMHDLD